MRKAVYHNLDFGGAKISLYEWIKYLKNIHNIEIDYYKYSSLNEKNCNISTQVNNTFIYHLPEYNTYKNNVFSKILYIFKNILVDKMIAKAIDNNNYDLVFVHHSKFIQAPYVMSFIKKTKIFYFCQEPYRSSSEFKIRNFNRSLIRKVISFVRILPKSIIDKYNFKSADIVLCNSEYSKKVIYNYYKKYANVVHLGVDINAYQKLKNLNIEKKIISTGILLPHKGYELTIKALGEIEKKIRPEFHIYHSLIATDYQLRFKKKLISLANENMVELYFHEQKSSIEIAKAYNTSLFAVYSAEDCPLGIVALEAMACGTPVIGSNGGGIRETIKDGVTGLLSHRDPKRFSEKIKILLDHNEIRETLASNCRDYIEEYWSWQASANRLVNNFKNS